MVPKASGVTPSQNAWSSTCNVARSHSCATFFLTATYFFASPAFRTSTYVASATTCAFVTMQSWPSCRIEKPLPVDSSCALLAHGIAGCWLECTVYTLTTGSACVHALSSSAEDLP